MKWNTLTDKCKNCQWLHVFSLFMDGDHEYSCGHDPNCMRENGWSKKKKDDKPTCAGCKFLDYYNDGEPFCIKNISHACISSGFNMREATE